MLLSSLEYLHQIALVYDICIVRIHYVWVIR